MEVDDEPSLFRFHELVLTILDVPWFFQEISWKFHCRTVPWLLACIVPLRRDDAAGKHEAAEEEVEDALVAVMC